jgi:crotonobetainyl-CoA:carnitine CoA-transferase CaiB-like acyl-CoA transferase
MEKKTQSGPLQGIRIMDLTRLYPGPLATMMMGDMGAEIIKIEDTSAPDYMRYYPPYIGDESAGFLAVNRSKRSLALNLKTDAGRDIFYKLLSNTDIVVEPFRPGLMDKMELGYSRACEINRTIIYVSLTGYGQSGPYTRDAGHDINFIGYSGILAATGTAQTGPVIPGPQLGDIAGGAYMTVIACLAALQARKTTGCGQQVDVSMLDGLMPLMTLQMAHYFATGCAFTPADAPLSGGLACYGVYRCSDGKNVALGILEEKFWKKFCEMVDRPDWISQFLVREEEARKLRSELSALFLTRSRDDWANQAAKEDICLTPVLTVDELEHNPQLQARNMICKEEHPVCGTLKSIGPPIKFSRTPAIPSGCAPELGRDTAAILTEIGYQPDEIDHLRKEGIVILADDKSTAS